MVDKVSTLEVRPLQPVREQIRLTPSLTQKEATVIQKLEASAVNVPEVRVSRAQNLQRHVEGYIEHSRATNNDKVESLDQKKIDDCLRYFTTRDADLGMTPFERIAQIYEHLEVPTDPTELQQFNAGLEQHMHILGERAFDQHYENPEQYVSHGFDHSIRVANYANQIVENFPQILDAISAEYGIPKGTARFMIENATLFHDCGYCALARGSNKVAHSVGSLRIISDEKVRNAMLSLVNVGNVKLDDSQFFKFMDDLEGAVLFHNADKIEKGYEAKMQNTNGHWMGLVDANDVIEALTHWEQWSKEDPRGEWFEPRDVVIKVKSEATKTRIEGDLKEVFEKKGIAPELMPRVFWEDPTVSTPLPDDLLYYGRKTDLQPGDKRIGLEYREADTFGYSLLALLRVGDNLDLLKDRFSQVQRQPAFAELYRRMYGRTDLADPQVKARLIDEVLDKHRGTPSADIKKMRELGILLDAESFKHFGGCEALENVVFRPSQSDPTRAEVAIYVDEELFRELQQVRFKEKTLGKDKTIEEVDVTVAEYQIWRLKDAIKVNLHDGKPIQIRILNSSGMDITETTFLGKS